MESGSQGASNQSAPSRLGSPTPNCDAKCLVEWSESPSQNIELLTERNRLMKMMKKSKSYDVCSPSPSQRKRVKSHESQQIADNFSKWWGGNENSSEPGQFSDEDVEVADFFPDETVRCLDRITTPRSCSSVPRSMKRWKRRSVLTDCDDDLSSDRPRRMMSISSQNEHMAVAIELGEASLKLLQQSEEGLSTVSSTDSQFPSKRALNIVSSKGELGRNATLVRKRTRSVSQSSFDGNIISGKFTQESEKLSSSTSNGPPSSKRFCETSKSPSTLRRHRTLSDLNATAIITTFTRNNDTNRRSQNVLKEVEKRDDFSDEDTTLAIPVSPAETGPKT